jgi:hypothetical protein
MEAAIEFWYRIPKATSTFMWFIMIALWEKLQSEVPPMEVVFTPFVNPSPETD